MQFGLKRGAVAWVLASLLACSAGDEVPHAQPEQAPQTGPASALLSALRQQFPGQAELLRAAPDAPAASWPTSLRAPLTVQASTGPLRVSFALREARASAGVEHEGMQVHPGGLPGADVVRRPLAEGMEDLYYFTRAPARGEVRYGVDVSAVAGLRLVSGVLEFLDEGGMPRLRMHAPFVAGADGQKRAVTVEVEGCAVDRSAAAPWARPVVAPGRAECEVVVRFDAQGLTYPALLDPIWSTAGNMAQGRDKHVSLTLSDGSVVVMGGRGSNCPQDMCTLIERWKDGVFASAGALTYGRRSPGAAVLSGDRVLIGGGRVETSGGLATCGTSGSIYCDEAELWDNGAVTPAGKMAAARSNLATVGLSGDRVLFIAGAGSSSVSPVDCPGRCKTAELWEAGAFSPAGSLASGREDISAVRLPGTDQVLVVGGQGSDGQCTGQGCNNIDLWTPSFASTPKGSFAPKAPLPHGRYQHQMAVLTTGEILIAGGKGSEGACVSTRCRNTYLWANDATKVSFDLMMPIEDFSLVALDDGSALVTGGYDTACQAHKSYCNIAQRWTSTGVVSAGALNQGRSDHASSKLPDGRVLTIGGFCGLNNAYCTTAEIYDPTQPAIGGACLSGPSCPGADCFKFDVTELAKLFGVGFGVCSDMACNTKCVSPLKARTGQPNGACSPSLAGTDPYNDCSDGPCADGLCDGTGQCRGINVGSECAAASCLSLTKARLAGVCQGTTACPQTEVDCGVYRCQAGACLTSCATSAECAPDHVCSNGACVPGLALGAACTADASCVSGHCVDGVCCNTACDTACQACSAAAKGSGSDGTCGAVVPNSVDAACPTSADPCASTGRCNDLGQCQPFAPASTPCAGTCLDDHTSAGSACDGKGACVVGAPKDCGSFRCDPQTNVCRSTCASGDDCVAGYFCQNSLCIEQGKQGSPCQADGECLSAHCADGVCCSTACDGACQACTNDLKQTKDGDGLCGAAKDGSPDAACAKGDAASCGADGACGPAGSCRAHPPAGTACGAPACAAGAEKPSACDSAGACLPQPGKSCGLYACGPTACRTSCDVNADCAPGAVCQTATHQCVQGGVACAGPFSVKTPGGQEQTCMGYQCIPSSGCRDTCATGAECAPGYSCTGNSCVFGGAGAGGAGGASGSGASGGATGGAGMSGASGQAAPGDDGGCGCRVGAGQEPASSAGGALGLLLGALLLGRRASTRPARSR